MPSFINCLDDANFPDLSKYLGGYIIIIIAINDGQNMKNKIQPIAALSFKCSVWFWALLFLFVNDSWHLEGLSVCRRGQYINIMCSEVGSGHAAD